MSTSRITTITTGSVGTVNNGAFLWSVADLLRRHFKIYQDAREAPARALRGLARTLATLRGRRNTPAAALWGWAWPQTEMTATGHSGIFIHVSSGTFAGLLPGMAVSASTPISTGIHELFLKASHVNIGDHTDGQENAHSTSGTADASSAAGTSVAIATHSVDVTTPTAATPSSTTPSSTTFRVGSDRGARPSSWGSTRPTTGSTPPRPRIRPLGLAPAVTWTWSAPLAPVTCARSKASRALPARVLPAAAMRAAFPSAGLLPARALPARALLAVRPVPARYGERRCLSRRSAVRSCCTRGGWVPRASRTAGGPLRAHHAPIRWVAI